MDFRTFVIGLVAGCAVGCAIESTSEQDVSDSPESMPNEPPPAPETGRRPPPSDPRDGLYNPCGGFDHVILQGHDVYYPIFCSPPPNYVGDPPPTRLPPTVSEIDAPVDPEDGRIDDGDERIPGPCNGPEPC